MTEARRGEGLGRRSPEGGLVMTDAKPEFHPVVEMLSPNAEQRGVLRRRHGSLLVTAGAGTGKTLTLVARYLDCLARGLPLRSVVAVTFTRKAAREMRNRVREAIRAYVKGESTPSSEAHAWRARYEELDSARIDTLHGLCGEILRSHPAESGLDPRFAVLEEGMAGTLQHEAVKSALGWAADDQDLACLFDVWAEDLETLARELLRRRLDVQEAFRGMPGSPLSTWIGVLRRWRADALERLTRCDEWLAAVQVLCEARPLDPSDRLVAQRDSALQALEAAGRDSAAAVQHLACLSDIDLTGGKRDAWIGGAKERDAVRSALRCVRELWKAQAELVTQDLGDADLTLAACLRPLRQLFELVVGEYDALKEDRRALDYDDLEYAALRLLREEPTVLDHWQSEVQALLVDEFQDTNRRQMELLELLSRPRGDLFLVGDAKQSIYGFRGADVTVFRRLCQESGPRGSVLPLSTSYRAHEALVRALNALLRPVLGEREDPAAPWVAPFAPLVAHRKEPSPGFSAPYVELHLAIGRKTDGALERAADAVAARILELVTGLDGQATGDAGATSVGFDDVAILCRASRSFGAYEDALERAGVPYVTVAGRGFYERPEVRDVLNALTALANPTDDLALAGLLRSPAVGLSDGALYLLCRSRAGCATLWDVLSQPLWEAPGCPLKALDQEDAARLRGVFPMLERLASTVGRWPVGDVLKAFVDETGYRAALLRHGQRRSARNLDKLLDDARESGLVSVSEFLEYVRNLRATGVREGEARADAEGAVQIMSVHSAKGLEFPVVVIGDVGYQGGPHTESVIVDSELGIVPRLAGPEGGAGAVYAWAQRRARDQDAAETARLFYVAATRAKEMLLLSGYAPLKKNGALGSLGPWLRTVVETLGLAERELPCDEEGDSYRDLVADAGGCPVACRLYEPGWTPDTRTRPLPSGPERPLPLRRPPLLDITSEGRSAADLVDPVVERERGPWRIVTGAASAGDEARLVGWLVHEALAEWRCRGDDLEGWARERIASRSLVAPRLVDAVVDRSLRLLTRFAQSRLYARMASADARLHEVPYGIGTGQPPDVGRIDALFRENGVWYVVEFKTAHLDTPKERDELLCRERYAVQAQRYVTAVREMLGCEPVALLCLLDFRGEVSVQRLPDPG